jgi:hypothetical protein
MKDITAEVAKTLEFINQLMLDHDYQAAHEIMKNVIKKLSPIEMVQESEFMVFKRSDMRDLIMWVDYLSATVNEIEP